MSDAPTIAISVTGPVYVNAGQAKFQKDVLELLGALAAQGQKIMSQLDDAQAALSKINDATNQQSTVLAAEAASLQTVSDNLDKLIAQLGTTVPQAVLDGLQKQADAADALSKTVQAHADFAAALASKGAATPVPVAVPVATAAPAVVA